MPYKKGGEKRYGTSVSLSESAGRKLQALSVKYNKNKSDIVTWLLEPFPDPAEKRP